VARRSSLLVRIGVFDHATCQHLEAERRPERLRRPIELMHAEHRAARAAQPRPIERTPSRSFGRDHRGALVEDDLPLSRDPLPNRAAQ